MERGNLVHKLIHGLDCFVILPRNDLLQFDIPHRVYYPLIMDLLNSFFFLLSLIILGIFVFYFYRLAHHDKEEWMKKEMKLAVEEKEAEEWIDHSFAPQILTLIKRNPKLITKYTFFILLFCIALWSAFAQGPQAAIKNSFFYCMIYGFSILYIHWEPQFFSFVKNHLPRKMRQRFDNDWIRAYIFFFLPAGIVFFFLSQPFSVLSFLFGYTTIFLILIAGAKISEDMHKEEEHHRRKVIKGLLEEGDK